MSEEARGASWAGGDAGALVYLDMCARLENLVAHTGEQGMPWSAAHTAHSDLEDP